MDVDQQIYTLMGMAEEKIKALDQLSADLKSAMEQQTKQVTELHTEVIANHTNQIDTYENKQKSITAEFTQALNTFSEKSQAALKFKLLLPFILTILFTGFITAGATGYYVNKKLDVLEENETLIAEAIKEQERIEREIKSAEEMGADIRKCTRNGRQHLCVRVMTEHGSFKMRGSDVEDFYILKPK